MSTRVHLLTGPHPAHIEGEPMADSMHGEVRVYSRWLKAGRSVHGMSPREARHLAWTLCEAADEAERDEPHDPRRDADE